MTTDKKREFLIKVAYAAVIILLIYFVLKYAVNWIMPFIVAFVFSAILYPLIKADKAYTPDSGRYNGAVLLHGRRAHVVHHKPYSRCRYGLYYVVARIFRDNDKAKS